MITIHSPAKINLLLKITGKRPDGYHEIDTIMQELELADTLSISESTDDQTSLTIEGLKVPGSIEDNLVFKAAKLFQENCPKNISNIKIKFHLKKNIPPGSGMGGGSSNAVAALVGLNHFFKKPFSREQLISFAAQLGSDTVFFMHGGRCHCSGRGEIVNPLDNKENTIVTLFVPQISVSTAQVFKNFSMPEKQIKETKFQFNDLEPAAFKVAPELSEIKNILREITGNDWQMTGSGSTFFNMLPDLNQFKNNYSKLKSKLNGQMIQTSFQYKGCHVSNR